MAAAGGTRGSITAGRPLPARRSAPMEPAANDLPLNSSAAPVQPAVAAVAAVPAIEAPRVSVAAIGAPTRPSRPDARPMRLAFGAASLAAVSVMTVGFVRPELEQALGGTETVDEPQATDAAQRTEVRRVTRYVFLKRGERAPKGATVISPDRASQPRGKQNARNRRNVAPVPTRERVPQPAAAQPEAPKAPKPKVTTRQSGG